MKIAFIAWNSFQVLHFKPLLKALPHATLIIEKKKKSVVIGQSILQDINNNIAYVKQSQLHEKIDGVFDVIVTQTVFEQLYLFKHTKIAMLQYGYAKEPHNYGAWRSLADLNLVYGPYAYHKISYFSPTEIVGCPRYDSWYLPEFHQKAKENYQDIIDPLKKTILYAPSWGELSSFSLYIDELAKLATAYNVIVKLHHNTVIFSDKITHYEKTYPSLHFFYEKEDLLSLMSVSDMVISDYSGAIFDAVFCKKPLVLLSIPNIQNEKLDQFSLEITHRDRLGIEVLHPSKLVTTVGKAFLEKKYADKELYNKLYYDTQCATKQAIRCLENLISGIYCLSQQQLYVRHTVKELYIEKMLHKKAKKGKLQYIKRISKKYFHN